MGARRRAIGAIRRNSQSVRPSPRRSTPTAASSQNRVPVRCGHEQRRRQVPHLRSVGAARCDHHRLRRPAGVGGGSAHRRGGVESDGGGAAGGGGGRGRPARVPDVQERGVGRVERRVRHEVDRGARRRLRDRWRPRLLEDQKQLGDVVGRGRLLPPRPQQGRSCGVRDPRHLPHRRPPGGGRSPYDDCSSCLAANDNTTTTVVDAITGTSNAAPGVVEPCFWCASSESCEAAGGSTRRATRSTSANGRRSRKESASALSTPVREAVTSSNRAAPSSLPLTTLHASRHRLQGLRDAAPRSSRTATARGAYGSSTAR